jgi:hypothetical protein
MEVMMYIKVEGMLVEVAVAIKGNMAMNDAVKVDKIAQWQEYDVLYNALRQNTTTSSFIIKRSSLHES